MDRPICRQCHGYGEYSYYSGDELIEQECFKCDSTGQEVISGYMNPIAAQIAKNIILEEWKNYERNIHGAKQSTT